MPAGNYLLKVNNRNTRARCEICSKLTIKTPERRQMASPSVFIVKIVSMIVQFNIIQINYHGFQKHHFTKVLHIALLKILQNSNENNCTGVS